LLARRSAFAWCPRGWGDVIPGPGLLRKPPPRSRMPQTNGGTN
jgi:hypothetical protein